MRVDARRSTPGDRSLDALRTVLFPIATVVTPNLDEVRLITGIDVVDDASQRDAARALHGLGARWALVKGGHLRSSAEPGPVVRRRAVPRVHPLPNRPPHDHGAGDTLSAAMASALAHGFSMPDAVAFGKRWVTTGWRPPIRSAPATDRSIPVEGGLSAVPTPKPVADQRYCDAYSVLGRISIADDTRLVMLKNAAVAEMSQISRSPKPHIP